MPRGLGLLTQPLFLCGNRKYPLSYTFFFFQILQESKFSGPHMLWLRCSNRLDLLGVKSHGERNYMAVAAGADSCRICLLSLSPPRTAWCGSSQLPKHIPCNPGQAPGGQEWSSRKKPTVGNLEGSPGLPLKV